MMRVLFNAMQAGNQSGTGRYVEELLHALVHLEERPNLTVWWPEGVSPGPWADRVELLPQRAGLWHRVMRERLIGRVAPAYDVVHFPASIGPLDGGKNVVLTVHDCIFLRHPEWFRWERAQYYRWAGTRSAQRAAHIIADSQATARDVHGLIDIDEARITAIPLGVGDTFRPPSETLVKNARKQYGLPERFFLYVGTLEPRKNLARVVRSWDAVAANIPEDLVIAGRVGWKTNELDDAIAHARHRERIHRPGFIDAPDLPGLLGAARAFVWPSLYEGFGLPVLEAMACGTPVITSDTTSLPEVAGDAALLVDPCDEEAIAEAMTHLSQDNALRESLHVAGPARAAQFTWQRCAEETMAVYRRVAERDGG